MPTIETLNQEFDGTRFTELPIISINCSKNNTRIFIYDFFWKLRLSTSSKLEGFKNCKKKSTVAGQATGVAAGLKALRRGFKTVRVVIRGIGPGRLTAVKGLTLAGMNVVSISDFTALPEKGPRGRRQRHL